MPSASYLLRRLAIAAEEDWRDRAHCSGMWHLFDSFDTGPAVALCRSCPVRTECLATELDAEANGDPAQIEQWPVFGGLTGRQRAAILRKRRRGRRPRKAS